VVHGGHVLVRQGLLARIADDGRSAVDGAAARDGKADESDMHG
jgi:hypothetical protein